ncbi:MAG: phosphate ABC transporter permease PstA [Rhodospirillaceae bacterium]|jgi:phosphate transport system permease protein|nr:phosphate ABC transporter permease PstA [Rhodospirillaceae bacterium]MBT6119167.1 phosphate ABC transporter permease PstA [Rhodospirillaceae bacterium]
MTDLANDPTAAREAASAAARVRRRYAAERRFRLYGILAIGAALSFLVLLLASIVLRGYGAFTATEVELDVFFDPAVLDPSGALDRATLGGADYRRLIIAAVGDRFEGAEDRRAKREALAMISTGARFDLRDMVLENPGIVGTTRKVWLQTSADIDMLRKGFITREVSEGERRVSDRQLGWFDSLAADGQVRTVFNTRFLTGGDSREPERAGIGGAIVGSLFTMLVTLLLAFPFGVMTAVYLEEFAPKNNKWVDLIEVNINNLAAVPSIVFGLLGLAVFLNFFELPRSAPVVGGMTLALMTLPTIIIATRSALKAVPPSIREAALGVGASSIQVVTHHVLPLALPGILTGTIIGMAQALGETAPLLMIGMVAFIVDIPGGPTDPATVLPVQIFLWADSPERAFVEKTAAAIMVLLFFLILMNAIAILLRRRFERRW